MPFQDLRFGSKEVYVGNTVQVLGVTSPLTIQHHFSWANLAKAIQGEGRNDKAETSQCVDSHLMTWETGLKLHTQPQLSKQHLIKGLIIFQLVPPDFSIIKTISGRQLWSETHTGFRTRQPRLLHISRCPVWCAKSMSELTVISLDNGYQVCNEACIFSKVPCCPSHCVKPSCFQRKQQKKVVREDVIAAMTAWNSLKSPTQSM